MSDTNGAPAGPLEPVQPATVQPPTPYGYGAPAPGAYYPPPGFVPGYAPMQIAPKSGAVALIVSFFLPGVGSMMNGETGKGIGILFGWIIGVVTSWLLIGLPLVFGFWLWGMIDAFTGAQKWNRAHGIIS